MTIEELQAEQEAYLTLKRAISKALKGASGPRRDALLRWAERIDQLYAPIRERLFEMDRGRYGAVKS